MQGLPNMYKREFETLLRSAKIPKSLLLYGACHYQNELLGAQMLETLEVQNDEKLLVHYDEYHFATAKNFISQSSLFGDRNILIIKTDKAIPAKELSVLVELCAKNDSSYFFYHYFGEEKKITPMTKIFDKTANAVFVRLFKADYNDAMNMLLNQAQKHGLTIHRHALQHLYMVHMEDLSLCVNEFDKLSILGKEIQINDIDTLVYGLGTVSMDGFITKILEKKDFKEDFLRMVESDGNDEIRIINAIQTYITGLFLFHAYIKLNGSFDAREILGYPLPQHLANQRSTQSIKINLETYKTMLSHLIETEFKLKKIPSIEKNTLLLSALIKLQTFL